ncbi:MAG: VOC family protein [Candidatus Dormibacteria bacterium]
MTAQAETFQATQDPPGVTSIQHVGLTVRDISASEAWYMRVVGLVRAFVEPHSGGDGHTVVMTRPGTALFMGLDHHPAADQTRFSELRTGLDHLALQVGSRDEIDKWIIHLDSMGVKRGPLFEATEPAPRAQVTFRDPDGIPIELFWLGA